MFNNSILYKLFNITQKETKRKPMFNDLDSIFKKEENESAKKIQDQLSKKIKELEQDVTAIIKDFADCYVKKGGLKIYADELLRLYDVIKNTKDVHIDIVRLEKGYDLIIELGKEIDTTNIKLFKGIFKFMNEFMM